MLFTDEDARHRFHTSSTLLQVVCQMLESAMAPAHLQLELVDVEEQAKFWVALLVASNDDFEDSEFQQAAFKDAAVYVNKQFKRYDDQQTVMVESGHLGLLTVRVSSSNDFALSN